ncbi:chondroitinase-B domain-containing protein [Anaerophaga thermohalophila]|uniref:chondroitinase-B domain-containing protein n=1 Tax=Anaerophaga thermohalophila TaxID=177400 RepID=UPI000237C0C4
MLTLAITLQLGCYLASASEYKVYSAAGITALPTLQPGDVVIMVNKVWSNENIVFEGLGTEESPIIFKASNLRTSGSYRYFYLRYSREISEG